MCAPLLSSSQARLPLRTPHTPKTGAVGVVQGDAGEQRLLALLALVQVEQDAQLGARAQGGRPVGGGLFDQESPGANPYQGLPAGHAPLA